MGTAERKERERIRRQNDILDAAEEVFFDKGLQNATMDDVAEKAELSKGTLYLYFENKEALYVGISLRAMTALRARFEAAAKSEPTATEGLMALGRAYIDFALTFPYYFRTMSFVDGIEVHWKDGKPENALVEQCHNAGSGILEFIADLVEKGKAEGALRPDLAPMPTAVMLWATGNGVIQMHQSKGDHMRDCHGLPENFLLEEYMRFCSRALLVDPPEEV